MPVQGYNPPDDWSDTEIIVNDTYDPPSDWSNTNVTVQTALRLSVGLDDTDEVSTTVDTQAVLSPVSVDVDQASAAFERIQKIESVSSIDTDDTHLSVSVQRALLSAALDTDDVESAVTGAAVLSPFVKDSDDASAALDRIQTVDPVGALDADYTRGVISKVRTLSSPSIDLDSSDISIIASALLQATSLDSDNVDTTLDRILALDSGSLDIDDLHSVVLQLHLVELFATDTDTVDSEIFAGIQSVPTTEPFSIAPPQGPTDTLTDSVPTSELMSIDTSANTKTSTIIPTLPADFVIDHELDRTISYGSQTVSPSLISNDPTAAVTKTTTSSIPTTEPYAVSVATAGTISRLLFQPTTVDISIQAQSQDTFTFTDTQPIEASVVVDPPTGPTFTSSKTISTNPLVVGDAVLQNVNAKAILVPSTEPMSIFARQRDYIARLILGPTTEEFAVDSEGVNTESKSIDPGSPADMAIQQQQIGTSTFTDEDPIPAGIAMTGISVLGVRITTVLEFPATAVRDVTHEQIALLHVDNPATAKVTKDNLHNVFIDE